MKSQESSDVSVHEPRISWGAVLAGVIVGLAIQLLLTLLGVAFGASTIDPMKGESPSGEGIAMGAGIWMILSGIVSAFVGARIAANLSGGVTRANRSLHGVLSWGIATLVAAFFLTAGIGNVVGSALGTLDKTTVDQEMMASADRSTTQNEHLQPTGAADSPRDMVSEDERRQASNAAAKGATQAALWSFLLVLMGGLTSLMASNFGRKHEIQIQHA